MANLTITEVDCGSVIFEKGAFRDELLTFAAAATVLAGTILARDSSTGKMVPFVKGGSTNENGIPKAVLTYEVEATAAGDVPISNMVSGSVRAGRLVIDADGDATNIDAVVMDQMRDYMTVAVDVQELNILDNQ
ncbi:MAG: head decoration protein [Myxococcales bacterium]|nr:head decoration protein [Myxococcales bacterium]